MENFLYLYVVIVILFIIYTIYQSSTIIRYLRKKHKIFWKLLGAPKGIIKLILFSFFYYLRLYPFLFFTEEYKKLNDKKLKYSYKKI